MSALPNPHLHPTMSPADVAEALDVTVDSIRDGCRAGRIPVFSGRGYDIRSKQYQILTTWVYDALGLPLPASPYATEVA